MKMKKVLTIVLLATLVVGVLAAGGAKEAKGEEIKVALVGPITGSYSEYGIGMDTAARVAVDQWNAKGGINGKKIKMVSYDEKGMREEGLAISKLITGEENFYGVIGHFISTMVVGKTYTEARTPLIAATASSIGFTDQGDSIFRLNATINTETAAMMVCADAVGKKNLGVVYLNDDWGTTAYKVIREILAEDNPMNYKIVAAEPIIGGDMDYSSVISNLKAAGAETALMFCYYDSVVPFTIKAKAAYPELTIVCGGNCYNENFLNVGGKDVNGCLAPTVFDASDPNPAIQEFVKDYVVLSKGEKPSYLSAQAYDAMNILLEAIDSVNGELDREGIITAITNSNHQGVTGDCSFDENRDAARDFFAMVVENSQWVPF